MISFQRQKPAIYCDFDLMVDDDGKGYIIYTVWNAQGQPKQPTHMSVELLSDDYLSSVRCGVGLL